MEPALFLNLANDWKVLSLFIIPIGGGIPGGVLLAQSFGMHWIEMTILYFISDVLLALVFEPVMLLGIRGAHRSPFLTRFIATMKKSVRMTMSFYGEKLGVLPLILIAFGVDPMTGRLAARLAGHGFLTGWMISIAGDMVYFGVLMVSTLWLRNILGDGTMATLAILVVMTIVPLVLRKFRERRAWRSPGSGT